MTLQYHEFRPDPSLAPYLACHWHLSGTGGSEADAALPDGHPELILNSGDPFIYCGDGWPRHQARMLLVGQITAPFPIRPGPMVDVIGYRFHPGGVFALLGLPMESLTNRDVPLEAILPRLARRLAPVLSIPDPGARAAQACVALAAAACGPGNGAIGRAARVIAETHGRIRTDDLSVALGLSSRQVARRFVREIGVGPKLLGRIHRFQWFLGAAGRHSTGSLTRLAHTAGYYDQSHLIRDFREFTNRSPSAFLGEGHPLAKRLAGL